MPSETKTKTFWNRGWATILGIGALATVIIAVFGVFNLFKDPGDQATIEVTLGAPMTLQQYTAMREAEDSGSDTGARGSESGQTSVILIGNRRAPDVGSTSGQRDAFTALALNPLGPVLPNPGPVAPDPNAPDPVAPDPDPVAPDPDPVAPHPDPVAPNPEPDPVAPDPVAPKEPTEPSDPIPKKPGAPEAVAPAPSVFERTYGVALEDVHTSWVAGGKPVDANDPNRPELQPEEVEARLANMFSAVETTQGDGVLNLLGHTVTVNYTLEGYGGVPLVLIWSISGAPVSGEWAASEVEYDIQATTEHDGGTLDLWVPDLKAPGAYVVTAKLFHTESSIPIRTEHLTIQNAP